MLLKLIKKQKGGILPIVCGGMVALMGFSALAIDVGNLYANKARLQNIVDTAALAGALQLPDRVAAETSATSSAILNGMPGDTLALPSTTDNTKIIVSTERTVQNYFAAALGMKTSIVKAKATAQAGFLAKVRGAAPWGVEKPPEGETFPFDTPCDLKEGGGDGSNGNYHILALDQNDRGGQDYLENIMYGCDEELTVGDEVLTEPGNKSGKTLQGINYLIREGKTTVTVPIVESFDVNGRKYVKIVGFAEFEIITAEIGPGHECTVRGMFKRVVRPGEITDIGVPFGIRAVKLIE